MLALLSKAVGCLLNHAFLSDHVELFACSTHQKLDILSRVDQNLPEI